MFAVIIDEAGPGPTGDIDQKNPIETAHTQETVPGARDIRSTIALASTQNVSDDSQVVWKSSRERDRTITSTPGTSPVTRTTTASSTIVSAGNPSNRGMAASS